MLLLFLRLFFLHHCFRNIIYDHLLNVFLPDFISGPQLFRGTYYASHVGLPWWLSSEESACNAGVQETLVRSLG